MKTILILLFMAHPLAAQTFNVIHEKALKRDGRGKVEITEEGISYVPDRSKDGRVWRYEDIQYFDRISSKEFTILSYEDNPMLLGRDKQYHFIITEGELTDEIFYEIRDRLNKPATNREFPGIVNVQYSLPVKHQHTFGGCKGTLKFTEDRIYYVTDYKKDAREWRLDSDIQSVWSSDRYRLEIHTYENNRREFSRTRVFKFDLKEPLDPEVYRSLKLKLYNLEAAHRPLP